MSIRRLAHVCVPSRSLAPSAASVPQGLFPRQADADTPPSVYGNHTAHTIQQLPAILKGSGNLASGVAAGDCLAPSSVQASMPRAATRPPTNTQLHPRSPAAAMHTTTCPSITQPLSAARGLGTTQRPRLPSLPSPRTGTPPPSRAHGLGPHSARRAWQHVPQAHLHNQLYGCTELPCDLRTPSSGFPATLLPPGNARFGATAMHTT